MTSSEANIPTTTTNQNTNKKDPGWDHGNLVNPNNAAEGIKCKYCDKVTKGGISRHKQHLIGGFRNAMPCKKVPAFVREDLKVLFEERQKAKNAMDSIPHFDDIANAENQQEEDNEIYEVQSRGKRPISMPSSQQKKSKQLGPIDWFYKKDVNVVNEGKQGVSSFKATQYNETQKKLREAAVQKFARWMYDAGISFNAVNYDSFKPMIEAIGQYGVGMKPPSFHEMRVPCLKVEVEHTRAILKDHEEEKIKNGCTLMADGWRDRKGRSLINFLVNTSKGSMFVESVDASSYSHTGVKMFELLNNFVQRVGEKNVVQVITDSASSNVQAGKLLEAQYRHISWSPCAAHCLDLMFEDIFKIPDLKRTLERAISVNGYIYNRSQVLNMMREFTGQKDMIRVAKTRFATAFLTLRSFQKHKLSLRKMFTSENWNKSKFAREHAGKNIAKIMLMPSFWNNIIYAMKLAGPLVEVLRLVDGERKPPMGYIYEAMDKAKEKIAIAFGNVEEKYREIYEIIDKRWDCQLHQPLHAAGYFLNPQYFYENANIEQDEEVMSGLYDTLSKLVPDTSVQDEISNELIIYKRAEGIFAKPIAKRQRNLLAPGEWWASYGSSTPNLQKLAIKILNLTCSSSGCERNWSVFEHLHSKKRNRLEQQRLNDLVFIKYNRALKRRYDKRDTIDPIVLDNHNLDGDNEWLVGQMDRAEDEEDVAVFDGDDLTWGDVASAAGVDEAQYAFRGPRGSRAASKEKVSSSSRKRSTPSTSRSALGVIDEDELDFNCDDDTEEEENDVEHYKFGDDTDEEDIDLEDDDMSDE